MRHMNSDGRSTQIIAERVPKQRGVCLPDGVIDSSKKR